MGMNPNLKHPIQFDSFFESGNLDAVEIVNEAEYRLYMRVDFNSKGHQNWYYFKVLNKELKGKIKFHICNFTRKNSSYSKVIFLHYHFSKTLKPFVLSRKSGAAFFS